MIYFFIPDLIEEYEDKVGDMDIVCQGGEKIRCHSCVISCQSNVMRRSLRRGLDDSQLNCPKFTHTTMSKLLQIMYCSDASFEYANEMIEVSFKWAIRHFCIPDSFSPCCWAQSKMPSRFFYAEKSDIQKRRVAHLILEADFDWKHWLLDPVRSCLL